jgi:hypothetical protein
MFSSLIQSYQYMVAAIALWREAEGEADDARLAVLWTFQNRIGKPTFRPSLMRVILQPAAFSSMTNHGDPLTTKWAEDAPSTALDWKAFQQCCALVEANLVPGLGGDDPTKGAVFYESYPVDQLERIRDDMPEFSASKLTVQIGKFRFYAL